MGDEQVKEASWVVHGVTGASAYLHGVEYDEKRFREEVARTVEFIKRKAEK